MTAPDTDLLLSAAEITARAARVCSWVRARRGDLVSLTKDDRSPVTVADFASQAVVIHGLRELGATAIVAEETADALHTASGQGVLDAVVEAVRAVWPDATSASVLDAIDGGRSDGSEDRFWTLDPIDGTKGFLRGGQYAVSLALVEGGVPVLGVLGCPALPVDHEAPFDVAADDGVLYCAASGSGLRWAHISSPASLRPVPLQAPDTAELRVAESVESGHSKHSDTQRILELAAARSAVVRLDSQAKYAVVARGQADAYLRMPTRKDYREAIWDHAGGWVIASEAGCVITDISGRPLDFTAGRRLENNRGVLCAHATWHPRLLRAIEELGLAP